MSEPEFATRYDDVNGTRWYVRFASSPAGVAHPPVVMIAGLGEGSYLLPHARRLVTHLDVLVPDMPGFGRSRAPRRPTDVATFADALAHWVNACVGRPVSLVGSSFGCQIAVAAAQRHPDMVSRLVLNGPTFDASARSVPGQVQRWLATMWREPPILGPLLLQSYVRSGIRTPLTSFRAGLDDRIEDRLHDVHAPVLLVRGEHDRICPAAWLRELCSRADDCATAEIAAAAHTVDYAAAEELSAVTLPFLTAPAGRKVH